ncbi:MAG: prephenate dehydrogenase [Proteobacteria bacterium]|nr:prephenate dehydrogenase [SAR86 cluster bacterium]MDA0344801.1 prephenate dehydrogenase [Pseudomonadota bacterium]MDA0900052.1 prephenate dehydrogenase [Pseudomonadota bacterium]
MNKILVVGGGFMGYSLCLALAATAENSEISIVEPNINNRTLIQNKTTKFNLYDDLEKVSGDFDYVIICTQIKQIPNIILKAAAMFSNKAVITDISSSKQHLKSIQLPNNFVSSHPICGSDKSGPEFADSKLFANKTVVLINSEAGYEKKLSKFWESLKMEVIFIELATHDKVFGLVSHLPHIIARAYKESLDCEDIDPKLFAGSGKEIQRLGASNEVLWNEIFSDNAKNIREGLEKFEVALKKIRQKLT